MTHLTESVFVTTDGGRLERLKLTDLLYIDADEGGVRLVLNRRSYYLKTNIGTVEAQLPSAQFRRVSRQHIVNMAHIESYEAGLLQLTGGQVLPLGPQYRQAVLSLLPVLRTKLPNRH